MATQEEIKEGLIALFYEMGLGESIDFETFQQKIRQYLHSQGVRILRDELPIITKKGWYHLVDFLIDDKPPEPNHEVLPG